MDATFGTNNHGQGSTVLRLPYGLPVAAALAQNATRVILYATPTEEEAHGLKLNAMQMLFNSKNVIRSSMTRQSLRHIITSVTTREVP